MAALASRVTLKSKLGDDDASPGPEDFFSDAFAASFFPNDVQDQHGDTDHSLVYTSPRLPRPLHLDLPDTSGDETRLFSHFLWNSSLLLAEYIEADSLPATDGHSLDKTGRRQLGMGPRRAAEDFDIRGLDVVEMGAGTALPSIMAALLGAKSILTTDYPSNEVLNTLRRNTERSLRENAGATDIAIQGHIWGDLSCSCGGERKHVDGAAGAKDIIQKNEQTGHCHAFGRVIASDCLWVSDQHHNLRVSIAHFLSFAPGARSWVIAGMHTGRDVVERFFDVGALAAHGLETESMWEACCDGAEREWAAEREDDSDRKRWLVVGVLRRQQRR